MIGAPLGVIRLMDPKARLSSDRYDDDDDEEEEDEDGGDEEDDNNF